MERTKLSTKGQVVLPAATRARKKWAAGTQLEVVETDEGVLLRPLKPFPPTTIDQVCGMARYKGPPLSLADMDAAVLTEARRHK